MEVGFGYISSPSLWQGDRTGEWITAMGWDYKSITIASGGEGCYNADKSGELWDYSDYYLYRIMFDSNHVWTWKEEALIHDLVAGCSQTNSDLPLLIVFDHYSTSPNYDEYIDWVRVRKYTSMEPTVSFAVPVDLALTQEDIRFSNPYPAAGEPITIIATIHNIGDADANDVVVQFFDDGMQIGQDQIISTINAGGTGTAQVNWTAAFGTHNVSVIVDPYGEIVESSETNNIAYTSITIGDLSAWQYNRTIYINENSGNDLTDYQVLINLSGNDFPAEANESGTDIRFVDENGNVLNYWIEEYDYSAKNAKIWVKVPEIPANEIVTLQMYWGNPSANAMSDGDATFEFFDDFESSNLNKWYQPTGWDISSDAYQGNYSAYATGAPYHLLKAINMSTGILEGVFKFKETNQYHYPHVPRFDIMCGGPAYGPYLLSANPDGHFGYWPCSWPYQNLPIDTRYQTDRWYHMRVDFDFSTLKYWVYIDRELKTPSGLSLIEGTKITHLCHLNTDQNGTMYVDVSRIRKYAHIEPTVTFAPVPAPYTLSISESQTTTIGGNALYTINVHNPDNTPITLDICISGLDESWYALSKTSAFLIAGEEEDIILNITVPDDCINTGTYPFKVFADSKSVDAELKVIAEPIISELTPPDSATLSSNDVLFSWRTSVNSTTEIYFKTESDTEFTRVEGNSGFIHAITVTDLRRKVNYVWYARSCSACGCAVSPHRTFYIDNGIVFTKDRYGFTVERDYDQHVSIAVKNMDSEPHELLVRANNLHEDLFVGFVGGGSIDKIISLNPGETRDIEFAIHAQDSMLKSYTFTVNLTNLGAENITDYALVHVNIRWPNIDFGITEVSTNPTTLVKTYKVKNRGDPITDFSVYAGDELKDKLIFQPSIDHLRLRTGESVEFDAVPVLEEGCSGACGNITIEGAGKTVNLSTCFVCEPGKRIFVGQVPAVNITFSSLFDNDNFTNTNPSNDIVDSYLINNSKVFTALIMARVFQNRKPAYGANVSLKVWNSTTEIEFFGISDVTGFALFPIYGPVGNYSYKAEVIGYDASTETRQFSVNLIPKYESKPFEVLWTDISDSDTVFNLTNDIPKKIELDNSPFSFNATFLGNDDINNAIPMLYLQPNIQGFSNDFTRFISKNYYFKLMGIINRSYISFNIDFIPTGHYTAKVLLYPPNTCITSPNKIPISTSKVINVTVSEDYSDKSVNLTWQRMANINNTHRAVLNIKHDVKVRDLNKTLNLKYINTTASEYTFIYTVLTNRTINDTLIVNVTDEKGNIVYNALTPISFEKNETTIIGISVPINYANLTKSTFYVTVKTEDELSTLAVVGLFVCGVGVTYVEHELGDIGEVLGIVKCPLGIVPILDMGMASTDIYYAITEEELIESIKGVSEVGLSPWKYISKFKRMARSSDLSPIFDMMVDTGKVLVQTEDGFKVVKAGGKAAKGLPIPSILDVIGCAFEVGEGLAAAEREANKIGLFDIFNIHNWHCINAAPLRNEFKIPGSLKFDIPSLPVQNIEDVYVIPYFPRSVPSSYRPFNTFVMLNGHEIGRIDNAVPEGYYLFKADPSFINYATTGVSENTLTLDVENMNRGYYVPLGDYKIYILFKKLSMPVCAANQSEANQIIMGLSDAMTHEHSSDFYISSRDIAFSPDVPIVGDVVNISITIYNFGTIDRIEVPVQILDNGEIVKNDTVPYLPLMDTTVANISWSATTPGSHNICIKVNPDKTIHEMDYTNNEASKDIFINEKPEVNPPTITNIKPGNIAVLSGSLIEFNCSVTDDTGVRSVWLNYTTDNWITYTTKKMSNPYRNFYDASLTLSLDTEYKIEASDVYGTIGRSGIYTLTVVKSKTPIQTSIQLHTGRNLISLPLMPDDTAINAVLAPISGNYNIVWAYDASDIDHWKKYDPSAPFGNDLTIMEPGKGYWILMTSDVTLPISGTIPESTSINVMTGWNLIGYNSLNSLPVADALSSITGNYNIVWTYDASDTSDHWKKYDPGAPFGNDLTTMEPGKGYWILMNSDDTIKILE